MNELWKFRRSSTQCDPGCKKCTRCAIRVYNPPNPMSADSFGFSDFDEDCFYSRHLQEFWGASGDFYQSQWEKVYDFFGGDAFNMGIWGTIGPKRHFDTNCQLPFSWIHVLTWIHVELAIPVFHFYFIVVIQSFHCSLFARLKYLNRAKFALQGHLLWHWVHFGYSILCWWYWIWHRNRTSFINTKFKMTRR